MCSLFHLIKLTQGTVRWQAFVNISILFQFLKSRYIFDQMTTNAFFKKCPLLSKCLESAYILTHYVMSENIKHRFYWSQMSLQPQCVQLLSLCVSHGPNVISLSVSKFNVLLHKCSHGTHISTHRSSNNKPFESVLYMEFLNKLRNYQLLKMACSMQLFGQLISYSVRWVGIHERKVLRIMFEKQSMKLWHCIQVSQNRIQLGFP